MGPAGIATLALAPESAIATRSSRHRERTARSLENPSTASPCTLRYAGRHPEGVWTLPPTLRPGDEDRETWVATGESDRMPLKFVKGAAPDAS